VTPKEKETAVVNAGISAFADAVDRKLKELGEEDFALLDGTRHVHNRLVVQGSKTYAFVTITHISSNVEGVMEVLATRPKKNVS